MNVFALRDRVISDYASYVRSFVEIRNPRIQNLVEQELAEGLLWPEPLLQLNPAFKAGRSIDQLCEDGLLHPQCAAIFARKTGRQTLPLNLHLHQDQAIQVADTGAPYVLTTGTGSGKSLAYIIPIVNSILRRGAGQGVQAVIVYPMNALANSQMGELEKFLCEGFPDRRSPVTFARYTGQDSQQRREEIIQNPPDIILTNYVMLELMLTRKRESDLLRAMSGSQGKGLRWLVLDELHTYRGRQGSDVAVLVRRAREMTSGADLQCVGTSATIAGSGTRREQQAQVATVASQMFGVPVAPQHILGETLRRFTRPRDFSQSQEIAALRERLEQVNESTALSIDELADDPLSAWIEDTFGLVSCEEDNERFFKRAIPRPIGGVTGAAHDLAALTGLTAELCVTGIRDFLLAAAEVSPDGTTGRTPFAFRLHQWVSRGDTIYASLEAPLKERYLSVSGQNFVPGSDREKTLFPLAFCRECGHEFYTVWKAAEDGMPRFLPRALLDTQEAAAPVPDAAAGFIYVSESDPWPTDASEVMTRLPDDWLEEHKGTLRIKAGQRGNVPQPLNVNPLGQIESSGSISQGAQTQSVSCFWMAASLRFCPCCGVTYNSSQKSDFSKLSSLGNEGRSTATTILSLSLISALRQDNQLADEARKLLSFTDNRQDASLQAGHFNDFIETALLRAALYRAVDQAGTQGLRHDTLAAEVFRTLQLPFEEYARDPGVRFAARAETERALRDLLAYRLFRDLRRGWRVTSPNLEQCGLLQIDYVSLDELAATQDVWQPLHPALAAASPERRAYLARVLCDVLRRELAIHDIHLEAHHQEAIYNRAMQHLKAPPALWNFDEGETLERARVLFPRGRQKGSSDSILDGYLSARGAFGRFVKRELFPNERPTQEDIQQILSDLLTALQEAGIVEQAHSYLRRASRNRFGRDEAPEEMGYRLKASALIWKVGDGTKPLHDPLRTPRLAFPEIAETDEATGANEAMSANEAGSADGTDTDEPAGRVNPFFTAFYQGMAQLLGSMEAREHTAQVPYAQRQEREDRFSAATLPILYCSPTMELGVDIRQLNAVHLRNVPPTPANYAQRSGRAGRSGQAAIVWTYCTSGSPHDQYFFKRPAAMVAGAVAPPRLDLSNEELVRAHIHALWLHETGVDLKQSMREVLDLSGDVPTLDVQSHLSQAFASPGARARARQHALQVLASLGAEVSDAAWYGAQWLDMTLGGAPHAFDRACDRWRGLYRSAAHQRDAQHRLTNDLSRAPRDRDQARRLRDEAERQIRLLTDMGESEHSDFYTYRYFAAEGFLPGYNFPRLPLSAFIPGRGRRDEGEYLSRPRFLAISEFGPRALIYHEGSRYVINQVILPPSSGPEGESTLPVESFKRCQECGFGHPVNKESNSDLCERCGSALPVAWNNLLRLQNVATRRRDRINCDEEERLKLGYEILTSVRWPEREGRRAVIEGVAETVAPDHATSQPALEPLAQLSYAQAATIWRINIGWKRRREAHGPGFMLDVERGYWEKTEKESEDKKEPDDPFSNRRALVIPFVEDTKNCLLFSPQGQDESEAFLSTLGHALKRGLLARYGLEDTELVVEPLPDARHRRVLLFYEATEGGAGALKHLLETPDALSEVAQKALEACHFDPSTGADTNSQCAAACYDCLLSYSNQTEHLLLDRVLVRDYLLALAGTRLREVRPDVPVVADLEGALDDIPVSEAEAAAEIPAPLWRGCESELERRWLRSIARRGHRWPDEAQRLFPGAGLQADFYYQRGCAIFVDGPHHDGETQAARDEVRRAALEDAGVNVIAFRYDDNWDAIFDQWPGVFGLASHGCTPQR